MNERRPFYISPEYDVSTRVAIVDLEVGRNLKGFYCVSHVHSQVPKLDIIQKSACVVYSNLFLLRAAVCLKLVTQREINTLCVI